MLQHNAEVVTGITTIAMCSINVQEPVVTNSLLQVAVMLHGTYNCLFLNSDTCIKYQSNVLQRSVTSYNVV